MSPPPLSHFPDLCLLAIFKHIPLVEVIHTIGLVCSNWSRVQRNELKRRHSTKHLVIAKVKISSYELNEFQQKDNPYGSDLIEHVRDDDGLPWARVELPLQDEFNTLRVSGDVLTERFTTPLIALLPNITHLTIFQKSIFPIDSVVTSLKQIVFLLKQYSTKLVSLKLYFTTNISIQTHYYGTLLYNRESSVSALVAQLFNSINRLKSLRHLSLNVKFPYFQANSRLRILTRLSTFTVHSFEPSSLLFASLRQYATAIRYVRINWGLSLEKHFSEMAELDPRLTSRFTRVSINKGTEPGQFIGYNNTLLICTRFNSLISLEMSGNRHMPMHKLAQCLSLLPQLISLHLSNWSVLKEERTIAHEITQVHSVRLFKLTMYNRSHHDTEHLHLHQIFPNLQVLHLIHSRYICDECKNDHTFFSFPFSEDPEFATRIVYCMCLARQPFRQCANLHTVKLSTDQFTQEELLTVDQWHAYDSRVLAEYKDRTTRTTSTNFKIIFNKILAFILSLLSFCKLYKKSHNS